MADETYMDMASRVQKEMRERLPKTWDEVRAEAAAMDWSDMRGKSAREVLSGFANTDRCIHDSEFKDAEKEIAERIIAALDAAGLVICEKQHNT